MSEESNIYGVFVHPEQKFVRGEGVNLFDETGRAYLDFTTGIAVNSLGHAHPHLVEALREQAQTLWHTSNIFAVPGQQKLAKRLCDNSFADKVFFTNSGAEALECAFKTARHYQFSRGNEERINIVTVQGAFHGRTLATIAAGGQEKYLEGFGPKTAGFIQIPFGDIEALKASVDDRCCAIALEPVQGEGGVRPFDRAFLQLARDLCDEHALPLIYDEVQTGIGRSGRLFAYELTGIEPDIMALAKGLGGGFPVGACLAREEMAASMTLGTHGTTFGGNPLAMSVANAVLDVILEDGFLDHVSQMAGQLTQILAEMLDTYPDLLEEIRGEGLLRGIKCKVPNVEVVNALREKGLLVVGAGDNVVRFLPPLIVTSEDLSAAQSCMHEAFNALTANPSS